MRKNARTPSSNAQSNCSTCIHIGHRGPIMPIFRPILRAAHQRHRATKTQTGSAREAMPTTGCPFRWKIRPPMGRNAKRRAMKPSKFYPPITIPGERTTRRRRSPVASGSPLNEAKDPLRIPKRCSASYAAAGGPATRSLCAPETNVGGRVQLVGGGFTGGGA